LQTPLREGDVKAGLRQGGHIRDAFVVGRCVGGSAVEYMVFLRASWRRAFLPLRTWDALSFRSYRDLDRLVQLIRKDFGFQGVINLYVQGDPQLQRYRSAGTLDTGTPQKSIPESGEQS